MAGVSGPADAAHAQGVLTARPVNASARAGGRTERTGLSPLGFERERDGLLLVPVRAGDPSSPRPLLVLLHGAGGAAADIMPMAREQAERHGVLALAPDSRGRTWDVIGRGYGPDVSFLDRALETVFRDHAVDPQRIAVAGFSDGGSYALSLGLANGSLFRHVLAFSPGFAAPSRAESAPRIFISHGRADPVLPIERCGRRLAATLLKGGYDVDYREFASGHVVPGDLVEAAFARFLG